MCTIMSWIVWHLYKHVTNVFNIRTRVSIYTKVYTCEIFTSDIKYLSNACLLVKIGRSLGVCLPLFSNASTKITHISFCVSLPFSDYRKQDVAKTSANSKHIIELLKQRNNFIQSLIQYKNIHTVLLITINVPWNYSYCQCCHNHMM